MILIDKNISLGQCYLLPHVACSAPARGLFDQLTVSSLGGGCGRCTFSLVLELNAL